MYKLFVTRVTKRISSHGDFLVPKQTIIQHSMRFCSFCNFYHGKILRYVKYYQIRTNTTKVLSHSTKKKKMKPKIKNYTELLAVTDETTSTKMAKVQKLTASKLHKLVDQSDVITNEMHDFRSPCSNEISLLKDLNNKNHVDTSSGKEIKYDDNLHKCHHVDNTSIKSDVFSDTSTQNDKIIINKKLNQVPESKVKIKSSWKGKLKKTSAKNTLQYMESLLVHMKVYIDCGMLNRAHNTLMKYRKHLTDKLIHSQICIELYNVLLEAYASKRKIVKVLELYNLIKQDSLTPTPQTYVYVFDALGREVIDDKQIALLKKLCNEMNNYNICFNNIFNESYFKNGQRENVLKSIRALIPDFKPSYTLPNTEYTCKLLCKTSVNNSYKSPVEELLTMEILKTFLKEQLQNESMVEVEIKSIDSCKDTNLSNSIKLQEVEKFWRDAASKAFDRNLKCLKKQECNSHGALMVLHPFLEVLDKTEYINSIIREVRQIAQGSETYSLSLKVLYIYLGKYIHNKYQIQVRQRSGILDKVVSIYLKYLDWYIHPENMGHLNNANNRTAWQHFEYEETEHGTSSNIVCLNWPTDIIINVGKFLYNIILNDLILLPNTVKSQDIKFSIPAFYTLFRSKGYHLSEQIKPHPLVSKLYKESQLGILTFESHILPTYVPPRPWTSIYNGGYLITKTDFIRVLNTNGPLRKLQNTPLQQLFPVFDSLNQLGSIPWIVNTKILDIIIEVFQNGGSEKLNVAPPVSVLSPPPPISKDATAEEKRKAAIAMAQYKQKKYDMYSMWCDTLYRLSIANHFRNSVFWLPHSLDFRGRVYPVPPHLNHLSSDLGRSLLLFAKGKPLGPNGLDWLKLHVINLTNFKKGCSMKERIEHANENMENILDSAANPMTGNMWWTESEEPWQTLAGCMEIANALKAPNVEDYVSRFPVHQDGSCNGLQHYAALGRDQNGAESVNLYPFDTPKDVYSEIAAIIEQKRQVDVKEGNKIAMLLEGFVKRKVIKQTIMTTVYGVTKYGAKHQIAKQLKDIENFPQEYVWPASIYLTESTFYSLRTMFKSAREIQDWFTSCARIIANGCGENVEWITPLGFPVVQPYVKQRKHSNFYSISNERPDTVKQKNAFAPNFIHSLDSSHMMLTSLYCSKENITFVSVHDCFWTHPCTVDLMNKICRQQFVALHSEPILQNLSDYFVQRYSPIYTNFKAGQKFSKDEIHKCLTDIPRKGDFDINNVLSSAYFFN